MLDTLHALLAPALMERLTLLANHVLMAEPEATRRLVPHSGRVLRMQVAPWPRLLPPLPPLAFRVTPAGGVEWCPEADAGADLRIDVDAGQPAALALRTLAGELPPVAIAGDAQLAADVDWLFRNLRWDIAADLERLFGPIAANQLHRLGSAVAQALRAVADKAAARATSRAR